MEKVMAVLVLVTVTCSSSLGRDPPSLRAPAVTR